MPAKVLLFANRRFAGAVTVFDSEPSFGLLTTAFPEAEKIVACSCCGLFLVHLGEATAMRWAD